MIYVGIDVASQKHDYFMINSQGDVYTSRSVSIPNTEQGYKKLHNSIKDFCGATNDFQVRIGLESTGFYHLNIISFLLEQKLDVMIINPLLINTYKKSKKVHVAKNDNIDSFYICKYLIENEDSYKPYTLKSYHTHALKALSRERFSLVNDLRLVKLNIYKLISQIFPEFLSLFSNIYQGSALDILTLYNNPTKISKARLSSIDSLLHGRCNTSAKQIIDCAKASIGIKSEHLYFLLKHAIVKLNYIQSIINEYDSHIKKYVDNIAPYILSVPGVSYTTAGLILGEINDISNFKNSDSLISYAGLDVIVYESGKYKASNLSISKKGSIYLRYALYQVAKVCWRFDPMFNAYYLKKQSENKHFYVILGHLEKKIVKVIYSVLKNNKLYSPQI